MTARTMAGEPANFTVRLVRLGDGCPFVFGFRTRDGADLFRARMLAPVPNDVAPRYEVGEVIAGTPEGFTPGLDT